MATLTKQTVDRDGLNATYDAAASGGDQWANGGQEVLHVKNGDTAGHTVTVASQVAAPVPGTAKSDVAVTVPAGEERFIGPFPKGNFNDANGNAQITYDAVTSVTLAVLEIP